MSTEHFALSPELVAYIDAHCPALDEVQRSLISETEASTGAAAQMRLGTAQAAFLGLLASFVRPRFAVEVGTFTGFSSIAIARSLAPDGRLLCCDVSEQWTDIARRHWEKAGLDDRIDLRIAPAIDTLRALPADAVVDLAFIDADKAGYVEYYEQLLPRLATHGLIVADNVLWSGRVVEPDHDDPDTVALRAFNDHVSADPRSIAVLTAMGDGLMLIRPANR